MRILELFVAGALALIGIYLFVLNSEGSSRVIGSIAGGTTNIITALQGQKSTAIRVGY